MTKQSTLDVFVPRALAAVPNNFKFSTNVEANQNYFSCGFI